MGRDELARVIIIPPTSEGECVNSYYVRGAKVAKGKPAAKKGGDMPMKGGHMMPGMPMKEKDMKGGKMPMKKKGY